MAFSSYFRSCRVFFFLPDEPASDGAKICDSFYVAEILG